MRRVIETAAITAALALSACTAPQEDSSGEAEAEVIASEEAAAEAADDELLERYIAAAVAASGGEEVLAAELRSWGDTSAGCPAEGMLYSQVITEGAMIVTRGEDGERYWHGVTIRRNAEDVQVALQECTEDTRSRDTIILPGPVMPPRTGR